MLHRTGKLEALSNRIKRPRLRISTELLKNEICYIAKAFTENNDFPLEVVNYIIDQEFSQTEVETVETKNHKVEQKMQLLLPYSGKQRHQLLSKMKKQFKRTLPDDINIFHKGQNRFSA